MSKYERHKYSTEDNNIMCSRELYVLYYFICTHLYYACVAMTMGGVQISRLLLVRKFVLPVFRLDVTRASSRNVGEISFLPSEVVKKENLSFQYNSHLGMCSDSRDF